MNHFYEVLKTRDGFHQLIPVTKEEILQAEEELQVFFSEEYKEYLQQLGCACIDGMEFTGICKSARLNVVDVTLRNRESTPNETSKLYVVEETNYEDIVIWQNEAGELFQTSGNSGIKKLCNSLTEYLSLSE